MGGDRIPGPLDDAVDEETRLRRESRERHLGGIQHGEGIEGALIRARASYAAQFNHLDEIAVDVYHSNRGSFLKAMADAWLKADMENKGILKWAWMALIVKYKLKEEAEG